MAVNELDPALKDDNALDSAEPLSKLDYFAFACGINFVLLFFIAGFMGPESPGASVPASQLADWYAKYRDVLLAQVYVRSLAAFSMFIFITGIVGVVRRAESRVNTLSLLAFGGAITFSLVMLISNMTNATAAVIAGRNGEPGAVLALDALGNTMRYLNALSGALMIGAASGALLKARAIPRWVGWLGLFCVPLFLAGAAGFPGSRQETLNLVAFLFLPLWPTLVSISLLLRFRGVINDSDLIHL
jgi:hypothetical protein